MKVVITNNILNTYFKNINNTQATLLGVNRKKRGWRKRLVGKSIDDKDLKEAISVKGLTPNQREERLSKQLGVEKVIIPEKKQKNVFHIHNFTPRKKIRLDIVSSFYAEINDVKPNRKIHNKLREFIRYYNNSSNLKSYIESSNVYLVSDDNGNYKIGKSNNVYSRLKSLQTGSNTNLTIVKFIRVRFALKTERFIHDLFSTFRLKGEWFKLDDANVIQVIKIMNRLDESDILKEVDNDRL